MILSLTVESTGVRLAMPLRGQFVALRLRASSDEPLLRSYSLSGPPSADRYGLTVKREAHGLGSSYIFEHVGVGTVLDVTARRGTFVLSAGEGPIVFVTAGIGVTPVLARLHALAAVGSRREI